MESAGFTYFAARLANTSTTGKPAKRGTGVASLAPMHPKSTLLRTARLFAFCALFVLVGCGSDPMRSINSPVQAASVSEGANPGQAPVADPSEASPQPVLAAPLLLPPPPPPLTPLAPVTPVDAEGGMLADSNGSRTALHFSVVHKRDCVLLSAGCPFQSLGELPMPLALTSLLHRSQEVLGGGAGWGNVLYQVCDPQRASVCLTIEGPAFPNGNAVVALHDYFPDASFSLLRGNGH